jgi:hypothetical protein
MSFDMEKEEKPRIDEHAEMWMDNLGGEDEILAQAADDDFYWLSEV